MAIVETLELALVEKWRAVTVFSDSRSVLLAVQARFVPGKSSYLVLRIKSLILKLTERGVKVKLVWVPGHCGVTGNERADAFARNAVGCGRDSQIILLEPLQILRNSPITSDHLSTVVQLLCLLNAANDKTSQDT
ncbi:uncharacterized protein LOC109862511, partial [Pseudomyrmex gracilis]|uniref:uncharacterized protein LOC109862511 n=1 Tax=Pseudomyrmex gracilis TaxID=219809 RepID=UPI000994D7F4